MNLQPTLKNELVSLRPLRLEDFDPLFQIAKDPLIWEQHPAKNRYQKEMFLDFFNDSIKSMGALVVEEVSTKKIIGGTRFKRIENTDKAVEIGWSFLSRDKWGGKYNKAFKDLMIDYALQHIDSVVFYIDVKNIRSQRAVEKLGGKIIITDSSYDHLIKQSQNDLAYRIGYQEWRNMKASRK